MNYRTVAQLAFLACMALLVTPVFAALEFDQDITPDVIFGSGNANGSFTTDRSNGIELGLRAKQRFPPANIFNSNGDGTYSFATGVGTGGTAPRPLWNFEWSVNTDFDGSTGFFLDDFTLQYELRIDFDPSPGTSNFQTFDPILLPFADHAIGDNSTVNGGGTVAGSAAAYASLLSSNNVAQNSWTMTFFDDASHIFDPDIDGTYTIELDALGESGSLASVSIDVIVGQGGVIPEPASVLAWVGLATCFGVAKWRKNKQR